MELLKKINEKKFILITTFLFFYIVLNLLDGDRGLISYLEKKKIKETLIAKKTNLTTQLNLVEKKNNLLTDNIDLDYLEILYRKKFMFGKANEHIYTTK